VVGDHDRHKIELVYADIIQVIGGVLGAEIG
jgi:hypothetical protein